MKSQNFVASFRCLIGDKLYNIINQYNNHGKKKKNY